MQFRLRRTPAIPLRRATCPPALAVLAIVGAGCSDAPQVAILAGPEPRSIIVPQRNAAGGRSAELIDVSIFALTPSGGVVVFDPFEMSIDSFAATGTHLGTLASGRFGGAPLSTFNAMHGTPTGMLYVLSRDGIFAIEEETAITKQITCTTAEEGPLAAILATSSGQLFLSESLESGVWRVLKCDPASGSTRTIHEDRGRVRPDGVEQTPLGRWVPQVVEDADGSILVSDLRDYRISVYSQAGEALRVIERASNPVILTENDLLLRVGRHKFPITALYNLPEQLRYLPSIVGIVVTRTGRKLVFTSERNREAKFRIDVFDRDWKFVGSDFQYNSLRQTPYRSGDGVLAVADIGLLGDGTTGPMSLLEAPKIPQRILLFGTDL